MTTITRVLKHRREAYGRGAHSSRGRVLPHRVLYPNDLLPPKVRQGPAGQGASSPQRPTSRDIHLVYVSSQYWVRVETDTVWIVEVS